MLSFPIPVKDVAERRFAGLLSAAVLIYAWFWLAAVVHDLAVRRRVPVGPATWLVRTLASHGVYVPAGMERFLLEPHPSVWLLVIPAVLANSCYARYGFRVVLILLSIQWCGPRQTLAAYAVAAATVGAACCIGAFLVRSENAGEYEKDAGSTAAPALVGLSIVLEAFTHPLLTVPAFAAARFFATAHFDDRARTRLAFGVCDDLRSRPLRELTALDVANAMWLARQPTYAPFAELSETEKSEKRSQSFAQWHNEQCRLEELAEHAKRRSRGLDAPKTTWPSGL